MMYVKLRNALLLLVCCSLIGGSTLVYAQGEDRVTTVTETYVNPEFIGVGEDEADKSGSNYAKSARSTKVVETVDEAAAYVHEELLKRTGQVTVKVNQVFIFGMSADIFQKAIAYKEGMTGNDGDYILAHFRGYSCNMSYMGTQPGATFVYTMNYLESKEREEMVDVEVKKVLDELNVYDQSEYIKVRAVHDWITKNIDYDYSLQKYSAYNAVVERSVVCQGFASLTYRMLKDLGVNVRYITGNPRANGTDGHAWNITKIGEKWYNVDNTWDENLSSESKLCYSYFLKNEADFTQHTRNVKFATAEFHAAYPMAEESYKNIEGITLNHEEMNFKVGEKKALYAWADPVNQKVLFKSTDPSVATVDAEGNVTAVKGGTAAIVAKSADGALSAACQVRVQVPVTGLSLSKTAITLKKGQTQIITAAIAPMDATNKAVAYTSANNAVARVDKYGKVTAVGKGTTTITATTADGSKKAVCNVTVTVPVTSVRLNKSSLSMKKGAFYKVTATVGPNDASNKAVAYSSSNVKVAKVDQYGRITAVNSGTANITVKTKDGNKTAVCKVTVTVPVTSVKLNKKTVTVKKGKTVKVTATVNPGNATNKKVTFESKNKKIAKIDKNGKITGVKKGTTTITVTTIDGKKKATCKVTVK